MAIKDLLNVAEAAEVIGCTESYVRRMLRNGVMNGDKLSERAWVVRRKEAERIRDIEYGTGRPRKIAASA